MAPEPAAQSEVVPGLRNEANVMLKVQPPDRFTELVREIQELHDRKAQDYGSGVDPLANLRASMRFGIVPWIGAFIRLNDKVHRIAEFAKRGSLANESVVDSMKDIALYALLALVLYEEESAMQELQTAVDKFGFVAADPGPKLDQPNCRCVVVTGEETCLRPDGIRMKSTARRRTRGSTRRVR